MKLLVGIFLIALALILGGALVQPITERWQDSNSYQRQSEQLDLERARQQEQERQRQLQATQASRDAAANFYQVGTILVCLLIVAVAADSYRQRRTPLIKPDRYGQLPVSRTQITDGDFRQLAYMLAPEVARIHQLSAAHQPGQMPVNLHQHVTQTARLPDLGTVVPNQLEVSDAPTVQTFAQLLDAGRVGKGNPLMLGYDTAEMSEISGSWLDLYSTAVSGMPGSGKTTSQRFLACQTALHGAKFAICDPHAGAADDSLAATLAPLSGAFVCEPASSDKAILEVVRYVADVGRRRIEGKDGDTTPLILWVDELTSLLGRSSVADELAELLERVAQEYRKRWVFVCASGQIWTAARTTSELRDSFASVLCHRMKRSQARLLLPTEEAEQVERLQIGTAVLWRTSGVTQTIAIPNTTAADCARVGGMLSGSTVVPLEPRGSLLDASWNSERKSDGTQTEVYASAGSSASERASTPSALDARIVSLFLDGNDAAEIVRQLWPDTKQGRASQERSAYVQSTLRSHLRRAA